MSPPTDHAQLENASQQLIKLREALRLKGWLEQTEGKARFTRDTGLTQSEDFMQKKAKYDEIEEQVRSRVVKV